VDADNIAPWVQLNFFRAKTPDPKNPNGPPVDSGKFSPYFVTVGNQSSAFNENTAIIKSFQYGLSQPGGNGCTVEISDVEGTSLQYWMEVINKSLDKVPESYKMGVKFGWTGQNCNGGPASDLPISATHYFIPKSIESTYEGGLIKYIISGEDTNSRVFESRSEEVEGNDKQRVPLKNAIRNLFRNNSPAINNVSFLRLTSQGKTEEWGFKPSEGGFAGPKSVWKADQQNAMATAIKWLSCFTTDKEKGIFPAWNSAKPGGELVFWEDTKTGCKESIDPCGGRSIGTYIVNGGKCSPVISFAPRVQWNFTSARPSGGAAGPGSAAATKIEGGCNVSGKGGQAQIPISEYAWDTGGGPLDAGKRQAAAAVAHERANMSFQGIECELKIQGDPTLTEPLKMIGRVASIVVINPYRLGGFGTDANWLAVSDCNEVFSNKAWMIKGVSHEIGGGSYTTTLKLFLATPGIDIDRGLPLGGAGSGGYVPVNT
jgi:hypothetical protein